MKEVYVDSNIFLDFLLNRTLGYKPVAEIASQFFKEALSCKYNIILSSWTIMEVNKHFPAKEFREFLDDFYTKHKIRIIRYSEQEMKQAKKQHHWEDILHQMLAQKSKAELIITRNIKHFQDSEVKATLPEML